jgi:hypothetical protein
MDNSNSELKFNFECNSPPKQQHSNFEKVLSRTFKMNPMGDSHHFKYRLSICEVIKRNLCQKRCLGTRQKQRVKVFDLADKYVKEVLDVFGYMDLVIELNNIKSAMFNNNQRSCLSFIERPTFHIKDDMDDNSIKYLQDIIYNRSDDPQLEKKKIAEYFAYKVFRNTLNKVDKVLIKQLNEDTANLVLKRVDDVKELTKLGKEPDFDMRLIDLRDNNQN